MPNQRGVVLSQQPFPSVADEAHVPDQAVCEAGPSQSSVEIRARAEDRLILACARAVVESEEAEQIRALVRQEIDWSYLIRKASRNGVMPLVCLNLINTCPELMPGEVLDSCTSYWREQARQNLVQTAALIKLLRLLDSHNVIALPFKGPSLAAYAYGNLSLRQFCDLDILVRKRDLKRIVNLLTGNGVRVISSPTWLQRLPTPASQGSK